MGLQFRPEFINRVDSVIVFHALSKDEIAEIVELELDKVSQRLAEYQINIEITEEAKLLLADLGYDPEMGARPLRRVIQNKVEDHLSDALLAGEFTTGDRILIDAEDDEILLRVDKSAEEDEEPEVLATS